MKQILTIEGMEIREAKNGRKYKQYTTSEGKINCFVEEAIKELDKNIGNQVEVELAKTGDFTNITAFHKVMEVKQEKLELNNSKEQGIYTSYAKDIYISLVGMCVASDKEFKPKEMMKEAIELVKQAKEGFK